METERLLPFSQYPSTAFCPKIDELEQWRTQEFFFGGGVGVQQI